MKNDTYYFWLKGHILNFDLGRKSSELFITCGKNVRLFRLNIMVYFINELAKRLNLKTNIETHETEKSISRSVPANDEYIPVSAIDSIIEGMKEVRAHQKGEIKLVTLDELIEELKSQDIN